MRILITSIIDLEKTAHNRLHEFIRSLSKNHDITVVSINDWWKAKQTNVKVYSQSFENILSAINIRHLTTRQFSPALQEVFSVLVLNKILEEIDYTKFDVHLNYNTLVSGYYVARKLKSTGINTVYDLADDLPKMIRNSPQIKPVLRPLGQLIGNIMVHRNISISTKTVCTTCSLKDLYDIPQSKFELIPNGVDIELFQNCYSQQLKKSAAIEADFIVGYVGVLREWIDLEPVFAAVSQLSRKSRINIKMLLVGEEGGLEKTRDLARRHEVLDKIIFTGTVPYAQIPEYISRMDVCLLPYKAGASLASASLPLKLLEYMACGKPVISSKVTGVAPALRDKMLYASNEREYQDRLMRLHSNRELRQKMGVEGRTLVKQGYSWSEITLRLERVLETVSKPSLSLSEHKGDKG